MKALPFRKDLLRVALVVHVVPIQHVRLVLETRAVAVRFDDTGWIVEKIIGVHHADLDTFNFGTTGITTQCAVPAIGVVRTNQTDLSEVFEDASDFVVASFGRVEVVEAGNFVQWRDRAPKVRGNTGVRITDQEGEMEAREEIGGHHGRIVWLGRGVEWVGRFLAMPIRGGTIGAVRHPCSVRLRTDSALLALQGRSDGG